MMIRTDSAPFWGEKQIKYDVKLMLHEIIVDGSSGPQMYPILMAK